MCNLTSDANPVDGKKLVYAKDRDVSLGHSLPKRDIVGYSDEHLVKMQLRRPDSDVDAMRLVELGVVIESKKASRTRRRCSPKRDSDCEDGLEAR